MYLGLYNLLMLTRWNKKKSLAKVAKALLEDPTQTVREIAAKTWVSKSTAANYASVLDKHGRKDDRIVGLTDWDFDIQKQIQEEKRRRLQKPEKINNKDLDTWDTSAMRRYTLFRWNATDSEWGVKDMRSLSDEELIDILRKGK